MLRRLSLRDFVIVASLEVEFGGGFSVLTGETGAGKSILVDALQLALGSRGDAGVVRDVVVPVVVVPVLVVDGAVAPDVLRHIRSDAF